MIINRGKTLAAAGLLTLLFSSPLAAQDLSAADRASIEEAARTHVETYYAHFYERDMAPLPREIFTIPWILLGAGGLQITTTAEEALASFEQSLASLLARDWNRSVWHTTSVCVLNAGTAFVSGTNTRTANDGSIMSVGGVTYILGRAEDGWRITSYAGHPVDRAVSC